MTALREVFARFGIDVDTSELEKGDRLVDNFKGKLVAFGAAIAGAFAFDKVASFTSELIGQADALGDTSEQLGVSTRQLQEWGYIAKLNGAEADDYTAAVRRLGAQLAEAGKGKGSAEVFKRLGVDLKDAQGNLRETGDVFEDVAAAVSRIENPTEQAGVAAELFGKQYAKLLPIFRRGPAGLAALRQEFAELGGGLSDDFIEQASAWEDNMTRLRLAGASLASQVLGPLLPVLADLSKEAVTFLKSLTGGSAGGSVLADMARSAGNFLKAFSKINADTKIFSKGLDLAGRAVRWLLDGLFKIEDVLVFFTGGKSLFGRRIDEQFGPGKAKLAQQYFQNIINMIGRIIGTTEGWQAATRLLGIEFAKVLESLRFGLLQIPAAVRAAFDEMWNSIVERAAQTVEQLAKLIEKLPGAKKLAVEVGTGAAEVVRGAKSFTGMADLEGLKAAQALTMAQLAKVGQDAMGVLKGGAQADALGIAKLSDAAAAQALATLAQATAMANAPRVAPAAATAPSQSGPPTFLLEGIRQAVEVNVTVPPGTDADMARRVGDAAGKGAAQGINLRGAKIAVGG